MLFSGEYDFLVTATPAGICYLPGFLLRGSKPHISPPNHRPTKARTAIAAHTTANHIEGLSSAPLWSRSSMSDACVRKNRSRTIEATFCRSVIQLCWSCGNSALCRLSESVGVAVLEIGLWSVLNCPVFIFLLCCFCYRCMWPGLG